MPNHARIEQGRGFQGVFQSEIRADQELPVPAHALVRQEVMLDLIESEQEKLVDFLMPAMKLAHHFAQQPIHLGLRQCHDAANDLENSLPVVDFQGPEYHATIVGLEDELGSLDDHGALLYFRT